jgi:hypothetical protein
MAYEGDLADRIRDLVHDESDLTEKRMFGGIAFLIGGNMAVAASGHGGLLLRVNPAESAALVANTDAYVAVMRGRPMTGWLRVDSEHLSEPDELAGWIGRGVSYARSLPAK